MRKFIIQFFALDYRFFIFGRVISFIRSANVIFPLIIFNGLLAVKENVPLELSVFAFVLLVVALFFSFIYFDIKPLKEADYNHFDDVQKHVWDVQQEKHPLNTAPQIFSRDRALLPVPISIILFLIFYFLL